MWNAFVQVHCLNEWVHVVLLSIMSWHAALYAVYCRWLAYSSRLWTNCGRHRCQTQPYKTRLHDSTHSCLTSLWWVKCDASRHRQNHSLPGYIHLYTHKHVVIMGVVVNFFCRNAPLALPFPHFPSLPFPTSLPSHPLSPPPLITSLAFPSPPVPSPP